MSDTFFHPVSGRLYNVRTALCDGGLVHNPFNRPHHAQRFVINQRQDAASTRAGGKGWHAANNAGSGGGGKKATACHFSTHKITHCSCE